MEREGLVQRRFAARPAGILVTLPELDRQRYLDARPSHRAVLATTLGARKPPR
jgi:hypothetical protein